MVLLGDAAAQLYSFRVLPPTVKNIRFVIIYRLVALAIASPCNSSLIVVSLKTFIWLQTLVTILFLCLFFLPGHGMRQTLHEKYQVTVVRGADKFPITSGVIENCFLVFNDDCLIRLTESVSSSVVSTQAVGYE